MTKELEKFFELHFWKGISPVIFSWLVIILSFMFGVRFLWLYPLAIFVIANRIMALGLLAHEGIHNSFCKKKWLNDFIARYFCAFPGVISLERWRLRHNYHHRFVGTSLDYDKYLYTYFPLSWKKFLWQFFTLQLLVGHLLYFTDLDLFLMKLPFVKKKSFPSAQKISFQKNDFKSFLIFHSTVIFIFFYFNAITFYIFFWIVPFLLCQPMTLLYNCLEHTKIFENPDVDLRSRSIIKNNFLLPLLLPLNVNYHAEHHLYPQVPQYNLPELSLTIRKNNLHKLYYQSLREALRAVFK